MRMQVILTIAVGFIVSMGCDTVNELNQDTPDDDPFQEIQWEEDVTGQLLPFDLVDNPNHAPASEIDYIDDTELIFITRYQGRVFAYPLRYMLVEVVNEDINGILTAVTYCPITKSAVAWNRLLEGDTLLLTASGYLLRDNLMPLDLNSGSIWSQMRGVGMHGKHDRVNVETVPLFETSWKTVLNFFPEAEVFTDEGQQKSSSTANAEGLAEAFSDRQFGILSRNQVELFDAHLFSDEIELYSTITQPGGHVVVAGSSDHHFVVAYQTSYNMLPVEGEFPIIMRDETGSSWNIFGEAVDGERTGEQLNSPDYYTASSWAWESLFANVSVFKPL